MPYYGAAKAALSHLTRSLALTYMSLGIRVNSVMPGPTETNFLGSIGIDKEQRDKVSKRMFLNFLFLKRFFFFFLKRV